MFGKFFLKKLYEKRIRFIRGIVKENGELLTLNESKEQTRVQYKFYKL